MLGVLEARAVAHGYFERAQVCGSRPHHRQRELPADASDSGHEDSGDRSAPADGRRQRKAPHRARQIGVEPLIAEGLTALRQTALQPGIPAGDEVIGDPPPYEITVRRELAEEAHLHLAAALELM